MISEANVGAAPCACTVSATASVLGGDHVYAHVTEIFSQGTLVVQSEILTLSVISITILKGISSEVIYVMKECVIIVKRSKVF